MHRVILQRMAMAVPLLVILATFVFILVRLIPGDPAAALLGEYATESDILRVRAMWGLDEPLWIQYGNWVWGVLVRLDLGRSFYLGIPVTTAFLGRMEPTIILMAMGSAMAIITGVTLGVVAAVRRNSWVDRAVMVVALIGLAVPNFWLGLILMFMFAITLGLLPASGYVPLSEGGLSSLRFLILPAASIGLSGAGVIARMTRSSMLDVLRQQYVSTARGKGLAERTVIYRHVLRNALIPTLTIIGLLIAGLAGGAIIAETVFAIPGSGRLVIQSVGRRDYPVIQGAVMLTGMMYVVVNLLIDILYTFLDPRVRYDHD